MTAVTLLAGAINRAWTAGRRSARSPQCATLTDLVLGNPVGAGSPNAVAGAVTGIGFIGGGIVFRRAVRIGEMVDDDTAVFADTAEDPAMISSRRSPGNEQSAYWSSLLAKYAGPGCTGLTRGLTSRRIL